jgi:predicted Zn-dependent peptidase
MAAFHDVLTAPEFRDDKVELARTQLRTAIARRNDDAGGIAGREFTNLIYGKDSPYGWDMEYATVDKITRADLQDFYQRYFFPANTQLAIWGDFQTAEMKDKITRLFADWTVQEPAVPAFPKVKQPGPGDTYLAVKKDVTQTFFSIGELGGVLNDKDYPALEVMADILGGGFQSRLMQQIRTKMGNAYDISASWGANYDHPGIFEISGSTKAGSTIETIKAIQAEVERLRTTEVSEEELKTAKDTTLNSLVFAFDTRTKTLGRMLTYDYFGYPQDFVQQYQKGLAAVTRADVLRVAKQHLDPARFTIVAVGNPDLFDAPLESLGKPVNPISLTIAPPASENVKPEAGEPEAGKTILSRAQDAAGGADKLAAVKDFVQTVTFQLSAAAGGLSVKETDRWIAPSYFRQESAVPSGKISAYFDGKTGWIFTPQGSGPLTGPQLQQVQGDLFRSYFRLLLSDQDAERKVVSQGPNTVEISAGEDVRAQAVFDPDTGLLQKVVYDAVHVTGPALSVEDVYSDYRDVDGIKVPFQITITQGGQKFADVTVQEIKLNAGLKLADLEKRPEN